MKQQVYILTDIITYMAVNSSAFITTVVALCICIGLLVVLLVQKNREIEELKAQVQELTNEYNALAERYNSGSRSASATEGGLLRNIFDRVEGVLQRFGGQGNEVIGEQVTNASTVPETTQRASQSPEYVVNEKGVVVEAENNQTR